MYRYFINTGIINTFNTSQPKKVRLLNIYSLIWFFLGVLFLLMDYIVGEKDFYVIHIISVHVMILVIYLNKLNLFKWSRLLWFIHAIFNFFVLSVYISPLSRFEYFFLILSMVSISLYNNKKISVVVLVVSYILFLTPYYWLPRYSAKEISEFKPVASFALFLAVFLMVNYFSKLNLKNEELLKLERDKILKDKMLLEKQQKELKVLEEFKSHFFVNLSHEIRTPLTLIKGYASRITLGNGDVNNNNNLDVIKSQAQYIHNIIDDILDLARLETNELSLKKENIAVEFFIKKIYADFDELYKKKEINFILDLDCPPLLINIDVNYFRKALNNLLFNSCKFTSKKGEVVLKISYKETLDLSVIDNGIGIPKKDLKNVFNRFYQSKNDITKSQGSGIGLAFTKSIIDTHRFELNLESTPNEITKFTIRIPKESIVLLNKNQLLKTPVFIEENNIVVKEKNSRKLKKSILIVEDREEMRNYLKLILSDYNIIEATNGQEGLNALQKNEFEIIITDYMMPVMDGVAFIKEVKKRCIKTPVIVITARSDDRGKLDVLRLGVDVYITKPFLEEELILNIKRSIRLYDKIKDFHKKTPIEEQLELKDDELLFNNQLKNNIEKNYKNISFSVENLADSMQLSRSSLFRKTKLYLGQTPNEIINEVRFQKAKDLIKENHNIKKKDLAEAVGIHNATYFYKKLKERFSTLDK